MQQDVSTNAGASENPKSKKRQTSFRSSLKVEAILQRLRYVGEHMFGGDMEAYGRAVGFSRDWMFRILNSTSRLRMSTFTQFVESGLVRAEWLFCGAGPMCNSFDADADGLFTAAAQTKINSSNTLFDTTLVAPEVFDATVVLPECRPDPTRDPIEHYISTAEKIFAANAAGSPVILYAVDTVLKDGCGALICNFLRNKWLTAVILPCSAVAIDTGCSHAELGELIKSGAAAGLGIGETIGRRCRSFKTSVLAAAYDLGATGLVHVTFGNSLMHMIPAIGGTSFGAAIGATAYVDMLAIAELMRQTEANAVPGMFLLTGDSKSMVKLLGTTNAASRHFPVPQQSSAIVTNLSLKHDGLVGGYCRVFSALYSACEVVYKGTKGCQRK
jgi:hypothetical protein